MMREIDEKLSIKELGPKLGRCRIVYEGSINFHCVSHGRECFNYNKFNNNDITQHNNYN